MQVQSFQHRGALGIGKTHLFETHIAFGRGQRHVRIDDGVRLQNDLQGVGNGAQLLGGVHQGQRQIARAMQDAEGQRTDQHHIACTHRSGAPHADGPDQHAAGHQRQADVVNHPRLFHVHPAAPMRHGLVTDLFGQPRAFAIARGKRLDRPHVGNRIHQLATHPGGLRGKALMLGAAANAEAGDDGRHDRNEADQRGGHAPIHRQQQHDGADEIHDGRHDLPRQSTEDLPGGAAERGDAVAQRTGKMLGEVAHRVAGEMAEQIHADVHHAGHHGAAAQPAAQAPQQVFHRDQADEQAQRQPHVCLAALIGGHRVHQHFHAVLHRHRAAGRAHDQEQQATEMPRPSAHVVPEKTRRRVRQQGGVGGRTHGAISASANCGARRPKRACSRRSWSARPWCSGRSPCSSA